MCSSVVFFAHRPWVIIFIFNFVNLGMVCLLVGNKFYKETRANLRVILNELCVLCANYFIISLSDFVQGQDARVWTGKHFVNLIWLLIFANVGYVVIFSFLMPKLAVLRLKYLKYKIRA